MVGRGHVQMRAEVAELQQELDGLQKRMRAEEELIWENRLLRAKIRLVCLSLFPLDLEAFGWRVECSRLACPRAFASIVKRWGVRVCWEAGEWRV